jgi:hypothetical protein
MFSLLHNLEKQLRSISVVLLQLVVTIYRDAREHYRAVSCSYVIQTVELFQNWACSLEIVSILPTRIVPGKQNC